MAKKRLDEMAEESLPSPEAEQYPLAQYREGLPAGYHLCTLPSVSPSEHAECVRVVESATNALIDHVGEVLQVVHVLIVDSETEDMKTHEMVPCKRLILVCDDGMAYNTPSPHARHSLARQLAALWLPPACRRPPYVPPLLVEVRTVQSRDRSKSPWLQLLVDGGIGHEKPQQQA